MTDDKLLILRALSTLRQVRDAKLPELALLPSFHELIEDLTARLAQPEPETVGYLTNALGHEWVFSTKKINQYSQPLYTAPPQREWQGLTDEEKQEIYRQADAENWDDQPLLEAVEAKLKEKNNG